MEWLKTHCTFDYILMSVFFALAFAAAWVAAMVLRIDGAGLLPVWSMAGVAIGATGVFAALGIFLHQDRKRQDADEDIKAQLSEIRKELNKLRCMCEAERCNDVAPLEAQRRSWLFGLLCSSARR